MTAAFSHTALSICFSHFVQIRLIRNSVSFHFGEILLYVIDKTHYNGMYFPYAVELYEDLIFQSVIVNIFIFMAAARP